MVTPANNWIDILKSEVAKSNMTEVAGKIGYSRTAVSLALANKYVGSTDKLAEAVTRTFTNRIACPFLKASITPVECRAYHDRPIPQSSAALLKHWRACRTCEHRLIADEECEASHA